ncbi:hypothetical protein GCM10019997_17390 [Prevotella corporis]
MPKMMPNKINKNNQNHQAECCSIGKSGKQTGSKEYPIDKRILPRMEYLSPRLQPMGPLIKNNHRPNGWQQAVIAHLIATTAHRNISKENEYGGDKRENRR